MTLRPEFLMGHSEFNEFLWASTGIDENGAPLSVLSALARLDLDPWQEAAHLTALPREAAVAALATVIARLRRSDTASLDDATTADRLVALLRGRTPAGASHDANGSLLGRHRLLLIGLIALVLAGTLIGMVI